MTNNADYTDGEVFLIDGSGTAQVVVVRTPTLVVTNVDASNTRVTSLSVRRGTAELLSCEWGTTRTFYEYDGTSWTLRTSDTGGNLRAQSIAAHPSDFLNTYVSDRATSAVFRYDGSSFVKWIDPPDGTRALALSGFQGDCPIAFDESGDLLYVRVRTSDSRVRLYKYTVSSTTWSDLMDVPGGIRNTALSDNIDIAVNWTNGHIYLSRENGYFIYDGSSWSRRQAAPTGVQINGIAIFNTLATS